LLAAFGRPIFCVNSVLGFGFGFHHRDGAVVMVFRQYICAATVAVMTDSGDKRSGARSSYGPIELH
jgi:hypothetical protein